MSEGSDIPPAQSESIQVPVSALAGAQVGDTVSFVFESIDGDTATLSATSEDEGAEESNMNPEPSTISKAAALFKE